VRDVPDARPDVRQARVKLQQAELARKIAKTDYLPDAQLTVSYLSPLSIEGAPRQIASAALEMNWEPFDWGRKGRALASKDLEIRQAKNAARETEDRARVDINSRFRTLELARAQVRAARVGQEPGPRLRVITVRLKADATDTRSLASAVDRQVVDPDAAGRLIRTRRSAPRHALQSPIRRLAKRAGRRRRSPGRRS
jgi:Outer membrane efflux protein